MGKVEFAYGFKQMASPHFEKLDDGRAAGTILPVHYVSDGVSQAWMRRIVSGALEVVGNPFDPIPARLRVKRRLMSDARALRSIHFPSSMAERDIARARLAYEECLYLQRRCACATTVAWSMWCPTPTPRASTWPRLSRPCRFR